MVRHDRITSGADPAAIMKACGRAAASPASRLDCQPSTEVWHAGEQPVHALGELAYSQDMPEMHARRRDRLRAAVAALDADAALITSLVNVRYLTGLASSNAALLVPAERGPDVLATDSRYTLAAERDCPDTRVVEARAVEVPLADQAADRGMRRLAFEAHAMTVERHAALADTVLAGTERWHWSRSAGRSRICGW